MEIVDYSTYCARSIHFHPSIMIPAKVETAGQRQHFLAYSMARVCKPFRPPQRYKRGGYLLLVLTFLAFCYHTSCLIQKHQSSGGMNYFEDGGWVPAGTGILNVLKDTSPFLMLLINTVSLLFVPQPSDLNT